VCHAAACRRHLHTGVLADADLIPTRTSSPTCLSIHTCHFIFVSGATITCSFHLRSTLLHICLKDITCSITIITLAPYCLPTPPFQGSFATVQRSLHSNALPQNPSCSLPILVDTAHTRCSLPSANIDGFHMLPVCLIYYCSLFLATLPFFFWHPQFLTSWLLPVLCPFTFHVFFHPLPLTSPVSSLLTLCSGLHIYLHLDLMTLDGHL